MVLLLMMMMVVVKMTMKKNNASRTPLLLSLLHDAGEETVRKLLALGEDPGARDLVRR